MVSSQTKALIALIFTVFCWGVTPVFARTVSLALGPFDALVIRLVIGALIYVTLLAITTGFHFPRQDVPRLLLITFFGLFIYFVFSVFGFSYAPAGIGTLIMSTQPIIIAILAWAVGAERITSMTLVGLTVSFAGSVLLIWGDDLGLASSSKSDLLTGCGLIFLASLGWAFYVVFSRPLTQKHGPIKIAGLVNILMALPLLPFLHMEMPGKIAGLPFDAKFGLAFLTTVGTLSAISWNYGAARLKPSVLGASLYVMPLVAVIAGWLILDEAITQQILLGAAVILCGVALSQVRLPAIAWQAVLPFACLAFASFLWGGTPVAMRYLMQDASSSTAIFARMVPAGLIAVVLALLFRVRHLTRTEWLRLLIAATLGNFAYQAFSGFGIGLIPSSWTGVLFCLEPIFIAVGAALFLGERLSPRGMTGLALAIAGTILLAATGERTSGQSSFWGVALIVLSSVGWAVYTLVVRPVAARHGGLAIACLAIALTAAPTLLFVSPAVVRDMQNFGLSQWLAAGYVAVFSTIVAVACWTVALPRVKSSEAAMYLYLQPLVAALGGVAILGETLTTWFFAGAALIIVGVFVNQLDDTAQPKPNATPQGASS
jgi:drug/metabolite transporter (DMT)-like permease